MTLIGALAACGCAREAEHGASTAGKPEANPVTTTAAGSVQTERPGGASGPSYEVAIASAQADRVHALNGCDDKQGAPRIACVRAADRAYDAARDAAERIRGSGR